MSDDSADVVAVHAGDSHTRTLDGALGRWPTLVCDGWITPNHPRRVLRASEPGAGISFGMCPICAAAMTAAATSQARAPERSRRPPAAITRRLSS